MPARLRQGAQVAVAGGGPAGCFFAIAALQFARDAGLRLEVTIYEPRDFRVPGPKGCNMCAGIIPGFVLRQMADLGLRVPASLVQSTIDSYVLHVSAGTLRAAAPDREAHAISVYRGSGPRRAPLGAPDGFDAFLIGEAVGRGAALVREPVTEAAAGATPWVRTPRGRLPCDLVILAWGVNAPGPLLHGAPYAAPSNETVAQAELFVGEAEVGRRLGSSIHVFLLPGAPWAIGTLVPKGACVSVSLLGRGLGPRSLHEFLALPEVAALLPPATRGVCACRPRIAVKPGRGCWGERFVAVGDAAATRLYKNGIGTALATARQAAQVAVRAGVGAADFARGYGPLCRQIARDNAFGRALFALARLLGGSGPLPRAYLDAVGREQVQGVAPDGRYLSHILWGVFTGSNSYRDLARMGLRAEAIARLCAGLFFQLVRGGAL